MIGARRHKYNARATIVDGIKFPSRREANRYVELRLLEKAGVVRNLKTQVPYVIKVAGQHITTYRADFVYEMEGEERVEDSKGFRTDVYKLKKKLVEASYGITITET